MMFVRTGFGSFRFLGLGAFALYLSLLVYFSLVNLYSVYLLAGATLAVVLFAFGLRSRSLGLVSVSWISLAIFFVVSFVSSGRANYLTITVSVLLLLASYEFVRFNFVVEPVARNITALDADSLNRLQGVIRNHSVRVVQVLLLALGSSIALEYLSFGVIVINPPVVGVTIFAALAVLLVAMVTLLPKK